MMLDEFLDDYVPNVLKPMGGWYIYDDGAMATAIRRRSPEFHFVCCPLTATAKRRSREWLDCAEDLGIPAVTAAVIAAAADGEPVTDEDDEELLADCDPHVRARLLAGLGLQETK